MLMVKNMVIGYPRLDYGMNKGGETKLMAEIVIKGNKSESIMPVLDSAIRNQLKLLRMSINRTKTRINSFEQRYNMSTEQFMQKITEGMDDDNLDFVECIGERKILKRLEEEYKELEGLRICL